MKKFPKLFILALAFLALVACEKPKDDNNIGHVTQLSGQIVDEDGVFAHSSGPLTLKLCVYDLDNSMDVPVASCPIAADGSFSMSLPQSIDGELLQDDPFGHHASEGASVSDRSVKTSVLQGSRLCAFDGGGNEIGPVEPTARNADRVDIFFADGDCRVSGTISFVDQDEEELTDTYYFNLKRGWNWTLLQHDSGPNVTIRTAKPSGLRYYLGAYIE